MRGSVPGGRASRPRLHSSTNSRSQLDVCQVFGAFSAFARIFSVFPDLTRARCGTALAEGNRNRSRAGACPPGRESCCGIRLPPGETSFCRHPSPDQTASVHDVTRERDLVAAGVADGHPAGPAAQAPPCPGRAPEKQPRDLVARAAAGALHRRVDAAARGGGLPTGLECCIRAGHVNVGPREDSTVHRTRSLSFEIESFAGKAAGTGGLSFGIRPVYATQRSALHSPRGRHSCKPGSILRATLQACCKGDKRGSCQPADRIAASAQAMTATAAAAPQAAEPGYRPTTACDALMISADSVSSRINSLPEGPLGGERLAQAAACSRALASRR